MFLLGTTVIDKFNQIMVRLENNVKQMYLDEESFCENEENVS